MDSEVTMGNAAAWGLILGVITPYLVALVNQPKWSDQMRRTVALVVSAIVGLINALVNSQIEFGAETALASVATVVLAAQTSYARILKPLPATGIKALEAITSPGTGARGQESP